MQTSIIQKMDIFLPGPAEVAVGPVLFPEAKTGRERRCRMCMEAAKGTGLKAAKNKINAVGAQCQRCAEAVHKAHIVQMCQTCSTDLTLVQRKRVAMDQEMAWSSW